MGKMAEDGPTLFQPGERVRVRASAVKGDATLQPFVGHVGMVLCEVRAWCVVCWTTVIVGNDVWTIHHADDMERVLTPRIDFVNNRGE